MNDATAHKPKRIRVVCVRCNHKQIASLARLTKLGWKLRTSISGYVVTADCGRCTP